MGARAGRRKGQAALRLIIVSGVLVFAFLLGTGAVLRHYAGRAGNARAGAQGARPVTAQSPFDGRRAFATLERIVALGPRPSGSEALERLRGIIRSALADAGLEVREQAFDAETPAGRIPMVNLWGVVAGTEPGVILLSGHYETKRFDRFPFVGANDGGSSTAWLLEMARVLGGRRTGRSIWLVFFDGEEALATWSAADSLYGSRAFVEYLRGRRELAQVSAMINVDMIGDRYLSLRRDPDAPTFLTLCLWDTARSLGYGRHFLDQSLRVEDDQVPFRTEGVAAVNLIDFEYGASQGDHLATWHTERDTLDKVSADSLQVIGDVVYHALPRIEAHLQPRN